MRDREQEFAMTNEAMLAEFMARVSQVADVMDKNQPGQPEASAKLREAVEELRDVSQAEDAVVHCCVLWCLQRTCMKPVLLYSFAVQF